MQRALRAVALAGLRGVRFRGTAEVSEFLPYDERKYNLPPDEAVRKAEDLVHLAYGLLSREIDPAWDAKGKRALDSLRSAYRFLMRARMEREPLPRAVPGTLRKVRGHTAHLSNVSDVYVILSDAIRFLKVEGIRWGKVDG
jgi:hypothetical protein